MFGLTWSRTQASKLELAQRERDEARRVAKKIGKALREALDERDTLSKEVARLRKYEPVRDPVRDPVTGRWGKALAMDQRPVTAADSPALRGATAAFEAEKPVRHG